MKAIHARIAVLRRTFPAGSIAALLSAHLSAQTTISYTNGQTDATGYSVSPPNNPTTLAVSGGTGSPQDQSYGFPARAFVRAFDA